MVAVTVLILRKSTKIVLEDEYTQNISDVCVSEQNVSEENIL